MPLIFLCLYFLQSSTDTDLFISVDSVSELMGSYGPNADVQSFTTRVDEAPSGMTRRGVYEVESSVRDDARNVYLRWKWNFEVKADW